MNITYTQLQEIELRDGYLQFKDDDHDQREAFIAQYMLKHGKSKKSVIGKLSKMKDTNGVPIYIPRPKLSKVTKTHPETKAQMMEKIAHKLGMDIAKLEGIDKSPKLSLLNLLRRLEETSLSSRG